VGLFFGAEIGTPAEDDPGRLQRLGSKHNRAVWIAGGHHEKLYVLAGFLSDTDHLAQQRDFTARTDLIAIECVFAGGHGKDPVQAVCDHVLFFGSTA
jgi:hypothetical protein